MVKARVWTRKDDDAVSSVGSTAASERERFERRSFPKKIGTTARFQIGPLEELEIRKLESKLKNIELLERRLHAGEKLDRLQVEKIQSKKSVEEHPLMIRAATWLRDERPLAELKQAVTLSPVEELAVRTVEKEFNEIAKFESRMPEEPNREQRAKLKQNLAKKERLEKNPAWIKAQKGYRRDTRPQQELEMEAGS